MELKQFKITDGHYTDSDCQKIRDRLIRQMNSDNDNAPDVHLVYTLLSQQGLIKLFGSNMNDSLNFALSLTGKPAGTYRRRRFFPETAPPDDYPPICRNHNG